MDYVYYLISFVYKEPIIKQVMKKTVMGNYMDKTVEHYTGKISVSPLDTDYRLKFYYLSKVYSIITDVDFYEDCLSYIRNIMCEKEDIVLSAYTQSSDCVFIDVTSKVRMLSGPNKDFYNSTDFMTRKKHITEGNLYIIDKFFNLYSFTEDESFIELKDGTSIISCQKVF